MSELSLKALEAEADGVRGDLSAGLERAVGAYLGDSGSDKPGWPYPDALREASPGEVELELSLDQGLWRALEAEAGEQGVSVSQLAGHAALYYAAELDAGRVTQRILDAIEAEDDEAE